MNLILQAIKSLFRRVENSIIVNVEALSKKITAAQNTANTANRKAMKAQAAATNAQTTADDAQTAANDAQIAANHVYKATVSGSHATVIGLSAPEKGKIYTIVPTSTSTSGSVAYIKVGSTQYRLRVGVTWHTTYSPSTTLPGMFFRINCPLIVWFDTTSNQCYCLNYVDNGKPVEASQLVNRTVAPPYIFGSDAVGNQYKFVYMRVKSSTEGSTKLFDITVDDSGTITATEVTE